MKKIVGKSKTVIIVCILSAIFCSFYPIKADAASIKIIDAGMCGENVAYLAYEIIDTGEVVLYCYVIPIPGDCCIYSYSNEDQQPWAGYRGNINYVYCAGVVEAGSYCFYRFSNCFYVSLGESMLVLSDYCLGGCVSLESIDIPSNVTLIAKYAFMGDSSLHKITLPESLVEIGNYAFVKCDLYELELPNKLLTVGNYAFAYNRNLKNVYFGKSDLVLKRYAFKNCTSLGNVKPPKWVVCEKGVFQGCN